MKRGHEDSALSDEAFERLNPDRNVHLDSAASSRKLIPPTTLESMPTKADATGLERTAADVGMECSQKRRIKFARKVRKEDRQLGSPYHT